MCLISTKIFTLFISKTIFKIDKFLFSEHLAMNTRQFQKTQRWLFHTVEQEYSGSWIFLEKVILICLLCPVHQRKCRALVCFCSWWESLWLDFHSWKEKKKKEIADSLDFVTWCGRSMGRRLAAPMESVRGPSGLWADFSSFQVGECPMHWQDQILPTTQRSSPLLCSTYHPYSCSLEWSYCS